MVVSHATNLIIQIYNEVHFTKLYIVLEYQTVDITD